MNGYDGGYSRNRGHGPSWADPYGGGPGRPRGGEGGRRPWVGGYRDGYQGGSGGYSTWGPPTGRYGADYGRGSGYDEAYRRFDREARPRYSPAGGMYPAMGGRARYRPLPDQLRDPRQFSQWTRWF